MVYAAQGPMYRIAENRYIDGAALSPWRDHNAMTSDDEGAAPSPSRGGAVHEIGVLRRQARQLWQVVRSGDPDALERVLRSHPKYSGRPSDRLQPAAIKLRDAQEVVAWENGWAGWTEVAESDGDLIGRWNPRSQYRQEFRTLEFARLGGSTLTRLDHVLDALASPPKPTVAASVLSDLGYECSRTDHPEAAKQASSTPVQQALVAFASGLALGLGARSVTDEHLLLAFAYTEPGIDLLRHRDVDPNDVVAALAAGGVATPTLAPPIPRLPRGPLGPRVYFRGPGKGVAPAIHGRYPPGTVHTGFNRSNWKPGWGWVDAEDEVPLEEIVRSVVMDPDDVEVVPLLEAVEAERRALRRDAGE